MSTNINKVCMTNYGMLSSFNCNRFSNINLIIGENGTGKTFLLKALYSAMRTLEEYGRGDDIKALTDIVPEKLRWTFQVDKLGDLVTKSTSDGLRFEMETGEDKIEYQFSSSAVSKVGNVDYSGKKRKSNSIFVPAKEILSLLDIILESREVDHKFGFDDTYYDLAKALRIQPTRGKNYKAFSKSRSFLNDVIGGKVDFDGDTGKWYFKNNRNQKFSIGATSEGVKKLSIMDRLFANGYLDDESIIFIDELESALHPQAICDFLDIISMIAKEMNIQFFITSHSYFVIKKLSLIAMETPKFVTCISLAKNDEPEVFDLYSGMPNNSIIDTSIKLYEQEIEGGLKCSE